jgi:hypothetical protein
LPFDNQEGMTLLSKRGYPKTNSGIRRFMHDPSMSAEEVYQLENSWYDQQIKDSKQ